MFFGFVIKINMSICSESRMEPEAGKSVSYLPKIFEVQSIISRGFYKIGGIRNAFRTFVTFDQPEYNQMNFWDDDSKKLGAVFLQLCKKQKNLQQENVMPKSLPYWRTVIFIL